MKKELLKLYSEWTPKFKEIMSNYPNDSLHGPFLMSPGPLYENQKRKLLVIGKESFGWHKLDHDPEDLMNKYEIFLRSGESKGSPYWNIISKLETILDNERFSCLTTNINKFDVDKKSPKGKDLEEISKLDNVLIDEIQITKPDVCMFFTGPSFDFRIQAIFNGIDFVELPGFTTRQFCLLKHPKLPEHTFRAYHPRYLRVKGLEQMFLSVIEQQLVN